MENPQALGLSYDGHIPPVFIYHGQDLLGRRFWYDLRSDGTFVMGINSEILHQMLYSFVLSRMNGCWEELGLLRVAGSCSILGIL